MEPPLTNSTTLSEKKKKKNYDMRHLTPNTWYETTDTWHMIHDMWQMVGVNILSKFQLPSSNGLGVMMICRFGGKGWLTNWLTDLISNKGYCRTNPATPGLLIITTSWSRWHSQNWQTTSPELTGTTSPEQIHNIQRTNKNDFLRTDADNIPRNYKDNIYRTDADKSLELTQTASPTMTQRT